MAQTPKLFATKVTVLAALVQTIVRHPERASETACWPHWAAAYPKCKAATAEVVRRAVVAREKQIGGSGGSLEPPGPLRTHLRTGCMAHSE